MKTLHINTAVLNADYITAMSRCLDKLFDHYFKEVIYQLDTEAGINDLSTENLDDVEKGLLIRRLIAGAHAILDSFGSGSKMDTSNEQLPILTDYATATDLWNPARPQVFPAPIRGRPEGWYTNIFGEKEYSSGKLEGKNLEEMPNSPITAREPSRAFQKAFEDAEKWFKSDGYALETIEYATTEFWASVRANSGRYFKFG